MVVSMRCYLICGELQFIVESRSLWLVTVVALGMIIVLVGGGGSLMGDSSCASSTGKITMWG